MRKYLLSRPVMLALSLSVLASCGADQSDTPATPSQSTTSTEASTPANIDWDNVSWAHDVSDMTPDPAVTFGKLDNGMRYIIMANDTPEQTVALRLRIDTGSFNENDQNAGLSHFLEHMAFNGSTNVPEGEMVKILERFGLAFGADTNASTGLDVTEYRLDLPSVEKDMLDTGFLLMRETASELTLDPDAIDRERGVILSEMRLRDSVGLRDLADSFTFLAPTLNLANRLPIGTKDVIENAPAELFREIYDEYYRPENSTFVVVGDFEPADIEARIKETFGDWQGRGIAGTKFDLADVDESRSLTADFYTDPDISTAISINFVRNHERQADTAEQRRKDLIDSLGHRILNRRFSSLARAEDAVFIGAGSSKAPAFDSIETVSVSVSTTAENWEAALGVAEQELRRAIEFGFTEAELNEQLANIRTGLENQVAQSGTRRTNGLASFLSGTVNDTVFTTPQSGLERFEIFENSLTPEMVHDAFKAQWDGRGGPLIRLTNLEPIENAEQRIIDAYKASQSVAVTPNEDKSEQSFAYTDFGPAGEIISDERIEDMDIRTLIFANNVRLNLKGTDWEDNRIRISLNVGAVQLELANAPDGLVTLLNSGAMTLGGLEAHSNDELQSLLAGRTVALSFVAGDEAFGAGVSTTPDDFELQMQLLTAGITAPGYREEALEQLRKAIENFYIQLDAEPGGIAQRDIPRILSSGDKRFGLPTQEELVARNFTEIKQVLDRAMSEGAIEIGIVGDFNENDAIDIVSKTFGALPKRLASPITPPGSKDVKFPADRTPLILRHAGPAEKALAMIYWPTTGDTEVKQTYSLRLLRAVLGLKLTDVLREELGATYSPRATGTNSTVFPDYGFLSASSEVDPSDVDKVFAAIESIAADLVAGNITEDELQRARQPVLEGIEENRKNNGAWMTVVSTAQTKPEFLERFQKAEENYSAITTTDLINTAKTYLDNAEPLKVRIISDKVE